MIPGWTGGGGGTYDGDVTFFRVSFILEWSIKEDNFSAVKEVAVKEGTFVRSGYHLVQFLCFGVYRFF